MRSKVHIAGHPLHPILVAIPIGAFSIALIADVAAKWMGYLDGPMIARFAIAVGIVTALLAAVVGLVDYLALPLSAEARRKATWHLICNLIVVGLYALSWWLRPQPERMDSARNLSFLAFVLLLLSGWFGGELVFRHRVGVDEPISPGAPGR